MDDLKIYVTIDGTFRLWCDTCKTVLFEDDEASLRHIADIAVLHSCEAVEDA
jgi:hypothetical protein